MTGAGVLGKNERDSFQRLRVCVPECVSVCVCVCAFARVRVPNVLSKENTKTDGLNGQGIVDPLLL